MEDDGRDRPDWWRRNERLRAALGLPAYEPPRFDDGTYVHEVLPPIEESFDCVLRLEKNTARSDDWELTVDGEPSMPVERYKDEAGNVVIETSSAEFAAELRTLLRRRGRHGTDGGSGPHNL